MFTRERERAGKGVWVAPQYKDAEEGAAYERLRAQLLGEAPAHLPLLLERVRRLAKLEGDARTEAALQARARAARAGARTRDPMRQHHKLLHVSVQVHVV